MTGSYLYSTHVGQIDVIFITSIGARFLENKGSKSETNKHCIWCSLVGITGSVRSSTNGSAAWAVAGLMGHFPDEAADLNKNNSYSTGK